MHVLLHPFAYKSEWQAAFSVALPEAHVHDWPGADRDLIEYVVTWAMPPKDLHSFTNLRAILLLGAGYDHMPLDELPDVPLVRLTDPDMARDIALYCLSWVIHFQRDFDVFASAQQSADWAAGRVKSFPADFTVGVLGAGVIGTTVLDICRSHGYNGLAWSRSNHDRSLHDFLGSSDVVVNLLPASPSTHHLVGPAELAALGDGVLINVGRGQTVDVDALLTALDGPLRAAVLDVFEDEPLDPSSPLWSHPRLTVTPHVAGRTNPRTAAVVLADNIRRIEAGEQPFPIVG